MLQLELLPYQLHIKLLFVIITDKTKIFIGGHSAGGYLSGMVGFAPKYLQKHNIKNTDLAGIILLSAQVTKHFRVRKDCGDTTNTYVPQT